MQIPVPIYPLEMVRLKNSVVVSTRLITERFDEVMDEASIALKAGRLIATNPLGSKKQFVVVMAHPDVSAETKK
jgi:hypothetical protein